MQSVITSLPVRNLGISRAFFGELGFTFSAELSGPDSACMVIGENVCVMLVAEDRFRYHINDEIGAVGSAGAVLITLQASSRREVDEIVMRAIVAGGRPWPIADEGLGYSGSFQDPDGYLWQVVCPREPANLEAAVPAASQAGDRLIDDPDDYPQNQVIPDQGR